MSLNKVLRDIKNIKIQGATAVARAAIKALADYGQTVKQPGRRFIMEIERAGAALAAVRPTEPLLHNGLSFLISGLRQASLTSTSEWQARLDRLAADYLLLIDQAETKIVKSGQSLIKKDFKVFTHCHSSLVEKILVAAWQERYFQVFNTETRPLFQGRITASSLLKQGLPVTMVADSAADFLISRHSGRELDINLVILGADSISHQGNVLIKLAAMALLWRLGRQKFLIYRGRRFKNGR
jgi:ribose 1,5-bisphosphate isomerase